MLAAVNSGVFQAFTVIHVLAIVVAFGGLFVQPMVVRGSADAGASLAKSVKFVQLPALLVALVAGFGLVGMSDEAYKFSQAWVSIGFAGVIVAAVGMFLLIKALETGAKNAAMLTGICHLALVVAMWAMVVKPGFPS